MINRRQFFATITAAVSGVSTMLEAAAADFSFVHVTDMHIQPELDAAKATRRCFQKINSLRPDLVVTGGDLIFDGLGRPYDQARKLFELYKQTAGILESPVHNVLGNHDVFGLHAESGVRPDHPEYGKKMYEDRFGKTYTSFDHKGWHFILLDSIGIGENRRFYAVIDPAQVQWLRMDLEKTGKQRPIIVVTHVPLVTGCIPFLGVSMENYRSLVVTNAAEVLGLLSGYPVKAVLQGHTHVREVIDYLGCKYITSGSVCGSWWKGPRVGHPEGFGVLRAQNGEISWRYETYPRNL
jgi:3',5'-cyclic-AMP phosphodiesterase